MRRNTFARPASILLLLLAAFVTPATPKIVVAANAINVNVADAALTAATFMMTASLAAVPVPAADIAVNVLVSTTKAQRGRAMQAAVVIDIPRGLHVNSNRPLGKYAIPTTVRVTAPRGVRVSGVSFPRSVVRKFEFSEERLAVFEGRAVMRFNVTVPATQPDGVIRLRAVVRYQACSDTVCYPPVDRDLSIPVGVVGADVPVERINRNVFGGGGRRR